MIDYEYWTLLVAGATVIVNAIGVGVLVWTVLWARKMVVKDREAAYFRGVLKQSDSAVRGMQLQQAEEVIRMASREELEWLINENEKPEGEASDAFANTAERHPDLIRMLKEIKQERDMKREWEKEMRKRS